MDTHALLRIYMPGGILSPDELMNVIKLAKKFKIRTLQFGLRQDINITFDKYFIDDVKLFLNNLDFDYELDNPFGRNIVTSYAANSIFASESWLTEGTYLDILDKFDYKPLLTINIVDPNQGLVPLLTGNLNFIASKTNNYWYLKLDLPLWFSEFTSWPGLIYSDDISKVANTIENLYQAKTKISLEDLFAHINDILHGNSTRIVQQLKLIPHRLPYYEGFNKIGNKYWLGVYKRTYQFPVDFLEAVCELCYEHHLNKICITPWRSFLIKDIKEEQWQAWINLLGLYSINIRHSSVEMNWRVPDFDAPALELKMYLVNEFDKMDIRNYGLTFAIRDGKADLDAIVVIEKIRVKSMFKSQASGNYNIYHTVDFEPNTKEYVTYSKDVSYSSLPQLLQKLTKKFYEYKNQPFVNQSLQKKENTKEKHIIYQCKSCFTTYDEQYGDSTNFINPGTAFNLLPNLFRCPVCDAPKTNFEPIVNDNSIA
jgi:rubredoxin